MSHTPHKLHVGSATIESMMQVDLDQLLTWSDTQIDAYIAPALQVQPALNKPIAKPSIQGEFVNHISLDGDQSSYKRRTPQAKKQSSTNSAMLALMKASKLKTGASAMEGIAAMARELGVDVKPLSPEAQRVIDAEKKAAASKPKMIHL